jgi:hypothetical protein
MPVTTPLSPEASASPRTARACQTDESRGVVLDGRLGHDEGAHVIDVGAVPAQRAAEQRPERERRHEGQRRRQHHLPRGRDGEADGQEHAHRQRAQAAEDQHGRARGELQGHEQESQGQPEGGRGQHVVHRVLHESGSVTRRACRPS